MRIDAEQNGLERNRKRVDYKLQLYTMHVEECTVPRPGRSVVIRESTESRKEKIRKSGHWNGGRTIAKSIVAWGTERTR